MKHHTTIHLTGHDEFKGEEKALLDILNRWDPFPGSPENKYQSLADRILTELRRGGSGAEIEALIGRDMLVQFGTDVPELEVRTIRQEIMAWWRKADLT